MRRKAKNQVRFLVEWRIADDSVWYDTQVVSKPGGWLTRLAYPLHAGFSAPLVVIPCTLVEAIK